MDYRDTNAQMFVKVCACTIIATLVVAFAMAGIVLVIPVGIGLAAGKVFIANLGKR